MVDKAGPAVPPPNPAIATSSSSVGALYLLKKEPPTNDVEICCRFEDLAVEGHAHYARREYSDARDCYNALLQLAQMLKRESPLMKSTSHFFLSMAHNALADECLVRSDRDHADEADVHLKEAERHNSLAVRVLDYGDEPCPLQGLDKQLLEDYDTFARKPRLETILRGRGGGSDHGGGGPASDDSAMDDVAMVYNKPLSYRDIMSGLWDGGTEGAASSSSTISSASSGVPIATKSKKKKKKKKKKDATKNPDNDDDDGDDKDADDSALDGVGGDSGSAVVANGASASASMIPTSSGSKGAPD